MLCLSSGRDSYYVPKDRLDEFLRLDSLGLSLEEGNERIALAFEPEDRDEVGCPEFREGVDYRASSKINLARFRRIKASGMTITEVMTPRGT